MQLTFSLAAVALLGSASALPYTGPDPNGPYAPWRLVSTAASGSGGHPTAPVPSGSVSYYPHGTGSQKPYPTGGNTDKPIVTGTAPAPVTETTKIYTTTTVCPITTTEWAHNTSTVVTKLTTSTITVTSCAGGCHGGPPTTTTTPPVKPTHATGSETETITVTYPTTLVSTITSFVPCSTPVMSNSETTFYSTWLTVSYFTTSIETLTTSCYTLYPTSTAAPSAITTQGPTNPEVPEVVTSVTTLQPSTLVHPAEGTCPPAETVYSTVVSYITVHVGSDKATATPIKPGQPFTWSTSGSAGGSAQPTGNGGYAKPSGHAEPSGWVKPSGY